MNERPLTWTVITRSMVVLINANDEAQTISPAAAAGLNFALHPLQAASVDPVVQSSSFDSATSSFTVPGRTTAVFILYEAPENMINDLIDQVETLRDDGNIRWRHARVLLRQLNVVLRRFNRDHPKLAIIRMNVFVHQVNAFENAGILFHDTAAPDGNGCGNDHCCDPG